MNENPWNLLPVQPPFVLSEEKDKVLAFNVNAHPNHFLHLDIIPEPFVGRQDAPVVLLGNIGGGPEFEGDQPSAYKLEPAFQDRVRKNLLHDPSDFPLLWFAPGYYDPGTGWWERKLKQLLREFGNGDIAMSKLARSILSVEFFPYSAHRYGHDRLPLPSQKYSFALVRNAVQRGAVIVLRHGERRWRGAVPELATYPNVVRLKEVRRALITPGNCHDDGFQKIVRAIKASLPWIRSQAAVTRTATTAARNQDKARTRGRGSFFSIMGAASPAADRLPAAPAQPAVASARDTPAPPARTAAPSPASAAPPAGRRRRSRRRCRSCR